MDHGATHTVSASDLASGGWLGRAVGNVLRGIALARVHLLAGRDVRELGNTPGHINHWSSRAFADFVSEYATVTRVRRPFPWTVVVAKPVRVTSGSSRKVAETT